MERVVTKHSSSVYLRKEKKDKELQQFSGGTHTEETLTKFSAWEYSSGKVSLVFRPEGQEQNENVKVWGRKAGNGNNSVSSNSQQKGGVRRK